MNSPDIFSYLAKFLARSKVHLLKNRRQSLILFCIAMIGWTFQVQAQSASGTATPPANAPAATPAPVDPAATPPATTSPDGFDKSKVPPVTTMSRPGLFILPPGGPGYYSLWDMATGNKREKPPVAPYAPFAILTTPAYEIDFRYLDKPGAEKDFLILLKGFIWETIGYYHLVEISGIATSMKPIVA